MKTDTNTALLVAGALGIGTYLYLRRRAERAPQEAATSVAPQMSGGSLYMGQTGFQGRSLAPYYTGQIGAQGRPR